MAMAMAGYGYTGGDMAAEYAAAEALSDNVRMMTGRELAPSAFLNRDSMITPVEHAYTLLKSFTGQQAVLRKAVMDTIYDTGGPVLHLFPVATPADYKEFKIDAETQQIVSIYFKFESRALNEISQRKPGDILTQDPFSTTTTMHITGVQIEVKVEQLLMPSGGVFLADSLRQVTKSFAVTFTLRHLLQLLHATTAAGDKRLGSSKMTWEDTYRYFKQYYEACFHLQKEGDRMLRSERNTRQRLARRGVDNPNFMIASAGTTTLLVLSPTNRHNMEKPMVERPAQPSLKDARLAELERGRTPSNVPIYESVPAKTQDGLIEDPMRGNLEWGEAFLASCHSNAPMDFLFRAYTSNAMEISNIVDYKENRLVSHNAKSFWLNSGIPNPDTLAITPMGRCVIHTILTYDAASQTLLDIKRCGLVRNPDWPADAALPAPADRKNGVPPDEVPYQTWYNALKRAGDRVHRAARERLQRIGNEQWLEFCEMGDAPASTASAAADGAEDESDGVARSSNSSIYQAFWTRELGSKRRADGCDGPAAKKSRSMAPPAAAVVEAIPVSVEQHDTLTLQLLYGSKVLDKNIYFQHTDQKHSLAFKDDWDPDQALPIPVAGVEATAADQKGVKFSRPIEIENAGERKRYRDYLKRLEMVSRAAFQSLMHGIRSQDDLEDDKAVEKRISDNLSNFNKLTRQQLPSIVRDSPWSAGMKKKAAGPIITSIQAMGHLLQFMAFDTVVGAAFGRDARDRAEAGRRWKVLESAWNIVKTYQGLAKAGGKMVVPNLDDVAPIRIVQNDHENSWTELLTQHEARAAAPGEVKQYTGPMTSMLLDGNPEAIVSSDSNKLTRLLDLMAGGYFYRTVTVGQGLDRQTELKIRKMFRNIMNMQNYAQDRLGELEAEFITIHGLENSGIRDGKFKFDFLMHVVEQGGFLAAGEDLDVKLQAERGCSTLRSLAIKGASGAHYDPDDASKPIHLRCIKRDAETVDGVLKCKQIDGRTGLWWIENDLPWWCDYLLAASMRSIGVGCYIMGADGRETALNLIQNCMVYNRLDPDDRKMYLDFSAQTALMVRDESRVEAVLNTHAISDGDIKGGGTQLFRPTDSNIREIHTQGVVNGDMFVFAVPPGFRPKHDIFDITGFFHPQMSARDPALDPLHFPTAQHYAACYNLCHRQDLHHATSNFFFSDQAGRNTVCAMASCVVRIPDMSQADIPRFKEVVVHGKGAVGHIDNEAQARRLLGGGNYLDLPNGSYPRLSITGNP